MQKYEVGTKVLISSRHQEFVGVVIRLTKKQMEVSFLNGRKVKFWLENESEVGGYSLSDKWAMPMTVEPLTEDHLEKIKRKKSQEFVSEKLKNIASRTNYLTEKQLKTALSFIDDIYKNNIKDGKWFKPEE